MLSAQIQQLATQPNTPAKAQQQQALQKQKQVVDKELSEKAKELLNARLVSEGILFLCFFPGTHLKNMISFRCYEHF